MRLLLMLGQLTTILALPLLRTETKTNFINLNGVITKVKNCTVHFIEFAGLIDYSSLVPSTISITRNMTTYLQNSKGYEIAKSSTVNCILTVVMLPKDPGNIPKQLRKGRKYEAVYPGRSFIKPYHHHTVQHLVIFIMHKSKGSDEWTTYRELPQTTGDRTKVIPIFVLLYNERRVHDTIDKTVTEVLSGAFLCWYCDWNQPEGHEFELYMVECETAAHCVDHLWLLYMEKIGGGRRVLWKVFKINDWSRVRDPLKYRTPVAMNLAVASYLRSFLNHSISVNSSSQKKLLSLPQIYRQITNDYTPGIDVYPTGLKLSFHFVTGDGVYRIKPSFRTYVEPFHTTVWVCLAVAYVLSTILILLIMLCLWINQGSGTADASLVLGLVAVTFEQEALPLISSKSTWRNGVRFELTVKVVLVVWLLCGLFLGNAYKGMIQGHYVFRSPFVTQWNRLEDLADFTIFLPVEQESRAAVESAREFNKTLLNDPRPEWLILCDDISKKRQCVFYMTLLQAYYDSSSYKHGAKKAMIHRIEYICEDELPAIIRQNLTQPHTAFVSLSYDFNYYWATFEKEMKSNSSLQFYGNADVEDDFISIPIFYDAAALNGFHRQAIPRAMRALFSSGIYWLFRRWDPGVQKFSAFTQLDAKNTELVGLSFIDSDIGMIFMFVAGCFVLSCVCFVAEIMWSQRH